MKKQISENGIKDIIGIMRPKSPEPFGTIWFEDKHYRYDDVGVKQWKQ